MKNGNSGGREELFNERGQELDDERVSLREYLERRLDVIEARIVDVSNQLEKQANLHAHCRERCDIAQQKVWEEFGRITQKQAEQNGINKGTQCESKKHQHMDNIMWVKLTLFVTVIYVIFTGIQSLATIIMG